MFTKATKIVKPFKFCVYGISGSGKTYTSLAIADWLKKRTNKPTCVIDSENGSSCIYADEFEFDIAKVPDNDCSISRYISLLSQVNNYGQVIIDSLSHVWIGPKGALASVQQQGSKFQNWGPVTQQLNNLLYTILHLPQHVICTLRAKNQYEVVNENGKTNVKSLGLGPIMRDGIEYEFDVVIRMEDCVIIVEKSRFKVLNNFVGNVDTFLPLLDKMYNVVVSK